MLGVARNAEQPQGFDEVYGIRLPGLPTVAHKACDIACSNSSQQNVHRTRMVSLQPEG